MCVYMSGIVIKGFDPGESFPNPKVNQISQRRRLQHVPECNATLAVHANFVQ